MTLLALSLAGCLDPIVITEITDKGTACLDGDEIVVTFPGCLSSSCDTLTDATCTATLEGDVVVVTGHATYESQGDVCTADCGIIMATCSAPTLTDPGAVELSYAGEQGPLETCSTL